MTDEPKVEIRVGVRYGTHVDGFELVVDSGISRKDLRAVVKAVADELASRVRLAVESVSLTARCAKCGGLFDDELHDSKYLPVSTHEGDDYHAFVAANG
jgi:hypothetical protein